MSTIAAPAATAALAVEDLEAVYTVRGVDRCRAARRVVQHRPG